MDQATASAVVTGWVAFGLGVWLGFLAGFVLALALVFVGRGE